MNISTSLRVVGSNLDVDMWYFILKMFFFRDCAKIKNQEILESRMCCLYLMYFTCNCPESSLDSSNSYLTVGSLRPDIFTWQVKFLGLLVDHFSYFQEYVPNFTAFLFSKVNFIVNTF